MKTKLAQLGAIIAYEIRLHWRRRGLLMVLLGCVIPTLLMVPWMRSLILESDARAAAELSNWATGSGTPAVIMVILILPPVLAEAIPRDRQDGVRELLVSTPMSSSTYLAGKVLGAWISLAFGLAATGLLYGVVGRLAYGPFDVGEYLRMWMIEVGALAFYSCSAGVLLPAGQPSRQRAAFVGIVFTACYLLTMALVPFDREMLGTWAGAANPSLWIWVLLDRTLTVDYPQYVPRMIALVLMQASLLWLIVWGWMRLKERR
jgi:hypothetical protein